MKFSVSWLKDYIAGDLPNTSKLADLLTLHAFETKADKKDGQAVLEIKLLANRVPDASGHLGIAKEIAALLGKKFKQPEVKIIENKERIDDYLGIKIENPEGCLRYMARMVKGIKVASSPNWLQQRLKACGVKPINNVVDITNFVMLEYGQPLHAFDYDLIDENRKTKKQIKIRLAKSSEDIETLDKEKRQLDKSILVIADSFKPLGIAGIKGGKIAEITNNTKTIVIEAANFEPISIRRASQKLNLKTDASWRFQHGISPLLAQMALARAAALIKEICGGEILKGVIDEGDFKNRKINIVLNINKVKKFLGFDISPIEMEKSLNALGFVIKKVKPEVYLITPPFERQDILSAEDVIGEIVRFMGYDKVPATPAREPLELPKENELWVFKDLVRDWIKTADLEEVYNYAFLSEKEKGLLSSNWQKVLIEILNPNSADYLYLKPTLITGLVKNASDNFRFYSKANLFEIANVFRLENNKIKGYPVFSGIFAFKKGLIVKKDIYQQAKGLISDLFVKLGLDKDDFSFIDNLDFNYGDLIDKNSSVGVYINHKFVGVIGIPKENIIKLYDFKGDLMVWEIYLESLMSQVSGEREYEPLPKYPAISRDISILINQSVLIDKVIQAISGASPRYLEDSDLFDIFEGGNLPKNQKSLSFHLIFRAKDKTLESRAIDKEMAKINKALEDIGAEIR